MWRKRMRNDVRASAVSPWTHRRSLEMWKTCSGPFSRYNKVHLRGHVSSLYENLELIAKEWKPLDTCMGLMKSERVTLPPVLSWNGSVRRSRPARDWKTCAGFSCLEQYVLRHCPQLIEWDNRPLLEAYPRIKRKNGQGKALVSLLVHPVAPC